MAGDRTDLLQGTLDLLVLKALAGFAAQGWISGWGVEGVGRFLLGPRRAAATRVATGCMPPAPMPTLRLE